MRTSAGATVMGEAGRGAASLLERIPDNLLREPVDFLYAEHYRQLVLCDLLDDLALGGAGRSEMTRAAVTGYLQYDLPRHVADEEQDLFPCLRCRLRPEDGAGAVLERLSEEHELELRRAAALVELLRSPAPIRGAGADPAAAQGLFAFAEGLRRHLAWENKIVLPLARRRLRRADLALIGRGMARRRDIDFPE